MTDKPKKPPKGKFFTGVATVYVRSTDGDLSSCGLCEVVGIRYEKDKYSFVAKDKYYRDMCMENPVMWELV